MTAKTEIIKIETGAVDALVLADAVRDQLSVAEHRAYHHRKHPVDAGHNCDVCNQVHSDFEAFVDRQVIVLRRSFDQIQAAQ